MIIGKLIKKYLDENGITQTFICGKTNIPDSIFSNMLNGKRKIEIDEYESICKALNLPVNYFTELRKMIQRPNEPA